MECTEAFEPNHTAALLFMGPMFILWWGFFIFISLKGLSHLISAWQEIKEKFTNYYWHVKILWYGLHVTLASGALGERGRLLISYKVGSSPTMSAIRSIGIWVIILGCLLKEKGSRTSKMFNEQSSVLRGKHHTSIAQWQSKRLISERRKFDSF